MENILAKDEVFIRNITLDDLFKMRDDLKLCKATLEYYASFKHWKTKDNKIVISGAGSFIKPAIDALKILDEI